VQQPRRSERRQRQASYPAQNRTIPPLISRDVDESNLPTWGDQNLGPAAVGNDYLLRNSSNNSKSNINSSMSSAASSGPQISVSTQSQVSSVTYDSSLGTPAVQNPNLALLPAKSWSNVVRSGSLPACPDVSRGRGHRGVAIQPGKATQDAGLTRHKRPQQNTAILSREMPLVSERRALPESGTGNLSVTTYDEEWFLASDCDILKPDEENRVTQSALDRPQIRAESLRRERTKTQMPLRRRPNFEILSST
jgi:hypothetical protein